jgi:hypothetical protein
VHDVVRTADLVTFIARGGTANGNGPLVCMIRRRQVLALVLREQDCRVAVDDRSVNLDALEDMRCSRI